MFIFVLLKPNTIEVSISQGWFEPRRCSFPLNNIFEESIRRWDYNSRGKEGKGKGQVSPQPGSVSVNSLASICYFPEPRPLYQSLKKKIKSQKKWPKWKHFMLMNNNKLYTFSVASQTLHSIVQHTFISPHDRSQRGFFFSFLNELSIVIAHNHATSKFLCNKLIHKVGR